jgi:hypothetical protein
VAYLFSNQDFFFTQVSSGASCALIIEKYKFFPKKRGEAMSAPAVRHASVTTPIICVYRRYFGLEG